MKTATQVLHDLHRTFADGDPAAMLDHFHEDCVIREAPDLPFGGDWSGRDGVAALMARQGELFEMAPTVVGMYEIDESRVIMHTSMHFKSSSTGAETTITILEMYTVKDDRIIEALPFYYNAGALSQLASQHH